MGANGAHRDFISAGPERRRRKSRTRQGPRISTSLDLGRDRRRDCDASARFGGRLFLRLLLAPCTSSLKALLCSRGDSCRDWNPSPPVLAALYDDTKDAPGGAQPEGGGKQGGEASEVAAMSDDGEAELVGLWPGDDDRDGDDAGEFDVLCGIGQNSRMRRPMRVSSCALRTTVAMAHDGEGGFVPQRCRMCMPQRASRNNK